MNPYDHPLERYEKPLADCPPVLRLRGVPWFVGLSLMLWAMIAAVLWGMWEIAMWVWF